MPASRPTLYIGNHNYSSWSLRAWLLMRQLGIAFDEHPLELFSEDFHRTLAGVGGPGFVPVLVDDGFPIWDTLAITEYLAERHPDAGVWPTDPRDRARARSVCAEMHAGFGNLRGQMPMNIEARLPGLGWNLAVQRDIDRICAIWTELRTANADRGPFLFGSFCAADAFYTPIASRFTTYGVKLPPLCETYRQALLDADAMREWTKAALAENCFLPADEPYRQTR